MDQTENLPSVATSTEVVTPERAAYLLIQCNYEGQRKIRPRYVTRLAQLMATGRFGMSVIRLAIVGEHEWIIDGQHRLSAVVESQTPTAFIIVRQYMKSERELQIAYTQIDGGLNRDVNDAARALGVAERVGIPSDYTKTVTAALRLISNDFNADGGNSLFSRLTRLEMAEMPMRFQKEAYAYWRITSGGKKTYRGSRIAAVAAVGLVTFRYAPQDAERFWHAITNIENISTTDPVYHAYELLLTLPGSGVSAPKASRSMAVCWNNFLAGKQMKIIQARVEDNININRTPWEYQRRMTAKGKEEVEALFAFK